MTEEEWLACNSPEDLLHFLRARASDRKARLCAVACCFRDPLWCVPPETGRVILLAESFADGRVDERALHVVARSTSALHPAPVVAAPPVRGVAFAQHAGRVAESVCRGLAEGTRQPPDSPKYSAKLAVEREAMARLVRDIFGNPFRPVPFSPSWCTNTVRAVAQQMYDLRDFRGMPILADALQDAECDNEDILDHCRGPGPHVRGCWVVDLVLGKE
jgi:hypothetical protein